MYVLSKAKHFTGTVDSVLYFHYLFWIFSSDGESVLKWNRKIPLSDHQLTPPLTNEGVESTVMADHTHLTQLYHLVISQQQEIAALRAEQQQGFAMLNQQLEMVQKKTIDEQRTTLSDHAREQRIQYLNTFHATAILK